MYHHTTHYCCLKCDLIPCAVVQPYFFITRPVRHLYFIMSIFHNFTPPPLPKKKIVLENFHHNNFYEQIKRNILNTLYFLKVNIFIYFQHKILWISSAKIFKLNIKKQASVYGEFFFMIVLLYKFWIITS